MTALSVFCVFTAIAAVVSAAAAADQPLWNVPFPDSSVSRLRAAVTAPDTVGAASAPAVVVEESDALTVLDAKTGNRTYRFQLELGADPASLAPAVVGGNTNTDFHAWSTVTGATLWTAPKATVRASNEHLTVLTVAESSFQIRATATGKVYLTEPPLKNSFPAAAVSGPYVVVLQKAYRLIALYSVSGDGGANAALRSVWAIDLNVTGQASDLSLQVGPATAGAVPYVIVNSAARGQQWVIDRHGRVVPLQPFASHMPFVTEPRSLSTVVTFQRTGNDVVSLAVFNVTTRKVEWSKAMKIEYPLSTVKVFGDLVLVATFGNAIGLDAHTGKVLWTKAGTISLPATYGPRAIAVLADDGAVQVWSRKTGAVVSKTRVVAAGVLGFVAEPSLGTVVVRSATAVTGNAFTGTAAQPWTVPFAKSINLLVPAVTAGHTVGGAPVPAVVAQKEHSMVVLDARTGAETHSFKLQLGGYPAALSISVAGGQTKAYGGGAEFHAWSTINGSTLWTAPQAMFLSSNDHLTVLTTHNRQAFQVRAPVTGEVYLMHPLVQYVYPTIAISGPYVSVLQLAFDVKTTVQLFSVRPGAPAAKVWDIDFNVTDETDLGLRVGPATARAVPYVIVYTGSGQEWFIDHRGRITALPNLPFYTRFVSRSTLFTFDSTQKYVVSLNVFNIATQKVEWARSLDLDFEFVDAAVFADLVLVTTIGNAIGLDAHTGKVLWTKAGTISLPATYGPDAIAVLADDGAVQVWSRKTGAVVSKTRVVAAGVLGFVAEPSLGTVVTRTYNGVAAFVLE